jgi:hypothetical protein
MMMRLLFAKHLGGERTAIVMDDGYGRLFGGVAFLTEFTMNYGFRSSQHSSMEMRFIWEWCRNVASPDDFERERGWEKPPTQIENRRLLG